MNTYHIRQDPSGRLRFAGMETGRLTLHQATESTLVVHEAGSKYWHAIGSDWAYAPARFHVLSIIEKTVDGWKAVGITEFPIRKAE